MMFRLVRQIHMPCGVDVGQRPEFPQGVIGFWFTVIVFAEDVVETAKRIATIEIPDGYDGDQRFLERLGGMVWDTPQQARTAVEEGDQRVHDLLQWTVEIAVWLGVQPFFVAEQAFLQDAFVIGNAVDPAVATDGVALRHKTHDGEGNFIDGAF